MATLLQRVSFKLAADDGANKQQPAFLDVICKAQQVQLVVARVFWIVQRQKQN